MIIISCILSMLIIYKICLYEPMMYKINRENYCEVELKTTTLRNIVDSYIRDEENKINNKKEYYMNCYYIYGDIKYNEVIKYDEMPRMNSVSTAIMNKDTKELVCVTWYSNIMWICILLLVIALVTWIALIF